MKSPIIILLTLLSLLVASSGCVEKSSDTKSSAIQKCIELCKNYNYEFLDKSPCLSNEIEPDWVCDVAHSPRQAIDNLPENQCEAWRNKTAKHFVELDTNCNLIKAF